jgi:membrane-bound lytic murein transglycosylase A
MKFHLLPSIALLPIALLLAAASCKSTAPDYGRALPLGAPALLPLDPGEKHPDFSPQWNERADILPAVDNSIEWMKKEKSKTFFPMENVSHARALRSLERFRYLLTQAKNQEEFAKLLDEQFVVYKSAGWDAKGGGVLFTGYCTPILDGRLKEDGVYQYPLYSLPPDLVKGPEGEILGQRTPDGIHPYPTRQVIESTSLLEGKHLELVWLKDPIDAYIAHVNGSAFIRLQSGDLLRLGYAGKNGQPYRSLGQELVKDEKLKKEEVNLAAIRRWAKEHPQEVEGYLARNDSYVFFTKIDGNPRGSLNEPVTAGRSLATDKTLFPRASVTYVDGRSSVESNLVGFVHRFYLDQDTGGAIRTAGRADVYLGVGPDAEARAGATKVEGQLYYLFVKE